MCWKIANEEPTTKPLSFVDFRNANSLELVRLGDGSWSDVENNATVDTYKGSPRITVRGRPRGRTRRNNGFFVRNLRVEVIPDTPEQLEILLNQIRARIVPWNLLEREVKAVVNGAQSSGVDELEKALGGLVRGFVGSRPSSISADEVEPKWIDNLGTLPEQMQKLSHVEKLTAHGAGAVGSGATLATIVGTVERVAETAESIADVTQCVAG